MARKPKKTRHRLLVCPMNWGLGHASRTIFLIDRFLEDQRFEVFLAADGPAYDLLRSAFPHLPLIQFPSVSIRYHRYLGAGTMMILSLPKILINIYREYRYLRNIIHEFGIDFVLSDNRYGAYHKSTTNIFLTHQLRIPFPAPIRFLESLGQRILYSLIHKFDYCWIPDSPGTDGLAGRLSHPENLPVNASYIGPVSRFMQETELPTDLENTYDITVLLSGPEPQRSILEQKLIKQLIPRKAAL